MKNVKIESVGHGAVRLTASKGFILKSKVTKKEYDDIVTNDIKRWEVEKNTKAKEQPVAEAEENPKGKK